MSKVFSLAIALVCVTCNLCFSQIIIDDPGFSYTSPNAGNIIVGAIKKDNKSQIILLGGNKGIVKIDSLGKKISSFYQGAFQYNVYNSMRGLMETSDSKILAFGCFPGYQTHSSVSLVRVFPNGTVDPSFVSPLTGNSSHVRAVAELPDGTYICAMGGPVSTNVINRLNNDGSYDPNFVSPYSGSLQDVAEFIVQPDSSVLVVFENFIQKLNYDGTIDNSFNSSAVGPLGSGYSDSEVLDDGKILFLSNNKVYRLLPNGVIDNSFTPIVIPTSTFIAKRIVRTNNNKFYVYGRRDNSLTTPSVLVNRYLLNGTIDNTLNLGQGFNQEYSIEANALVSFDDGSFSVSGCFDDLNNVSASNMAMLTNSGSPVWMYKYGSGLVNFRATTIHVDANQKMFVGGDFEQYNGSYRHNITKLDQFGHIDFSFKPGTGFNANVTDIVTQPDGKIVVCGQFSSYNGTSIPNIVRLNPNGTIDNSFNAGTGFSGYSAYVLTLGIQSDGKILVGGDFGTYNNTSVPRLVRLLPNGSLDPTFTPSSGPDNLVMDLIVKPNDEILICGKFGTYGGTLRARIALLTSNGILNNSFVPVAAYAHTDTRSMVIQDDGKIVVGGDFYSFTDNAVRKLGRLNPDGSADLTFEVDPMIYNFPEALGISQNGRIVVGAGSISIFENDGSLVAHDNLSWSTTNVLDMYVNPSGNPVLVGQFTLSQDKYGISRLKLIPAIHHTQQVSSCGPFTWVNGNTYTTSTNTPQYTFTTADGVDSIVTLNLTILSNAAIDTQIACDSLTWIDGITYYSSTNTPTFVLQNAAGCDSTVTLNLTITHPSSGSDTQTVCGSYIWSVNGQTYTASGQYVDTIPNSGGCDSIITLDLTIIPDLPLMIENSFSMPSDANACVGEVAVTVSGNADFELDFDNSSQVITSSGYSLVTNLCAGIHDLHVTDHCGDTLSTTIVIPVDSNYVFNNPFIDSLAMDSLGVTGTNCDIYYAGIDTAYIDSIWANGNTVNVIWNIVDSNGSNFDTTSYVLNNGNGVYWLQLSVFCPNKSVGEYFAVTEAVYFNNGSVSTAGLTDYKQALFEVYPNPTNNQVTINFAGSGAELTVYDLQGKVVLKEQIESQGTISLEHFERGIYLFDLRNSQVNSVQRVVKQ